MESKKYGMKSIVSHLGVKASKGKIQLKLFFFIDVSSRKGHYICDVYDKKTGTWKTYDDTLCKENQVDIQKKRGRSAYILSFVHEGFASSI